MIQEFTVQQEAKFVAERKFGNCLNFKNPICMSHYRGGKLLGKHYTKNDITNEGVNTLLNVMFNGATQIANNSWFIGFINNASFSALANADTMASHAGWLEATFYSQSTRPAWASGTATTGVRSVTNPSAVVFNINGSGGTLYGIFVTSNSTISGTTGKLWATAPFASPVPVNNGDQLNITYTTSA